VIDRERTDLDRLFDQLSMRVRVERNDSQQRNWYGGRGWNDNNGAWMQVNRRQFQLDRRIDQGLRSGKITTREAVRLRAEFNAIARAEASYRAGGFSVAERADLDRRFDRLAAQIRWERRDGERYGYDRY